MARAQLAPLFDRIGRVARSIQYTRGLNPAQWEGLRFVDIANRFSRNPTALAKYLGTTAGTASQTIQALEKKGLIDREPDENDRRQTVLRITESGRDLLADDPLAQFEAALAAHVEPEVAEGLGQKLSQVLSCLADSEMTASFGICERCGHYDVDVSNVTRCALKGVELAAEDAAGLCTNYEASQVGEPITGN